MRTFNGEDCETQEMVPQQGPLELVLDPRLFAKAGVAALAEAQSSGCPSRKDRGGLLGCVDMPYGQACGLQWQMLV